MHIRGGSRRLAIASAAFLRRHGYYSKSAAKFGENEAKSDCGYRFGHKEQEMQEYFLSLLFLLPFVAETKSSHREQMHSRAAFCPVRGFGFDCTGGGTDYSIQETKQP